MQSDLKLTKKNANLYSASTPKTVLWKEKSFSVNVQIQRLCEKSCKKEVFLSVESSASSDRQQRRPDVTTSTGTQSIGRYRQLMTGSQQNGRCCLDEVAETGTQWAARYRGAVPLRQRRTCRLPIVLDTLRYVDVVEPMKLGVYHLRQAADELPATTDKLPLLTPVVVCWWLSLEPRRRRRCNSRCEASHAYATVSEQTRRRADCGSSVLC